MLLAIIMGNNLPKFAQANKHTISSTWEIKHTQFSRRQRQRGYRHISHTIHFHQEDDTKDQRGSCVTLLDREEQRHPYQIWLYSWIWGPVVRSKVHIITGIDKHQLNGSVTVQSFTDSYREPLILLLKMR